MNNKEISRRELFKIAGRTTGGLVIAGFGAQALSHLEAATVNTAEAAEQTADGFVSLDGIPTNVTKTLTVARARAEYNFPGNNTWGVGTEGYVATPGVVLFQMHTPENIAAAKANMGESRWREAFQSPANSDVITDEQGEWRAPEGRWARLSLGQGIIEMTAVGGQTIRLNLKGAEDVHHDVYIRGRFKDGSTPRDMNEQIRMTNLVGGNVYVEQLPFGSFISQGQFEQLLQSQFEGNGNVNGYEGARRVYRTYVDLNTKAASVGLYTGPRSENGQVLFKNH